MKNLREFFKLKKGKRIAWLEVILLVMLTVVFINGTKLTQQNSTGLKGSITETGIKIEDNSSEKISVEKSIEYEKNFEDSYNSTKEENLMVTQMSLNEFNSNNDAGEMINSVESEESSIKYVRNKLYAGEEIIETNSELIKGVTEDLLVETSATKKRYNGVITINKDGSAWSGSGMKIDLSTSSENDTATYTNTVSSGSTATFDNLEETYYIWAGMYDGAKSTMVYTGYTIAVEENETATINYYTITKSQGVGTYFDLRYSNVKTDGNILIDGSFISNQVVVLGNNKVTIEANVYANAGYNTPGLYDGSVYSNSSSNSLSKSYTVNSTLTLSSYASKNNVVITLNKDGSAWTDGDGYTVHISTSSTSDTVLCSGTTTSSSTLTISGAMATSSTYYVWIGKDSNHKSTMVYSGVSFTGAIWARVTVNFYTITASLSNLTMTFNGTSLSDGEKVVALGTASAIHSIEAILLTGYKFLSWESNNAKTTITSTTAVNTTLKAGAEATVTLHARWIRYIATDGITTSYFLTLLDSYNYIVNTKNSASGTITATDDIPDNSVVTIDAGKEITIDTNGYTITLTSSSGSTAINNKGKLTIKGNGKIKTSNNSISNDNTGVLNIIENTQILSPNIEYGISNVGNGKVTLKRGKIY